MVFKNIQETDMDVDKDCFCDWSSPCGACVLFDLTKCKCINKHYSKLKRSHCVRFGICSRRHYVEKSAEW